MKGILFTEPMFRAVVAGQKTQTRRLGGLDYINDQEDVTFKGWETDPEIVPADDESKTINRKGIFPCFKTPNGHFDECFVRPRYQPGEVVYLKEPYRIPENIIKVKGGLIDYKYDWKKGEPNRDLKFNNKLFMPAKYARYFIRIKDVRVERLLDISEEDAIAEGIIKYAYGYWKNYTSKFSGGRPKIGIDYKCPIDSYKSLWQQINGKDSWDKNPFVFAYTFELTSKPETSNQ